MPALPATEPNFEEDSTMQTNLTKKHWLSALGAVALLTACGGGSDSGTPPVADLVKGTDLPVAVEQSTKGLIDFAKSQLAATSESTEPLLIGDAKLAVDDTAEPSDV
jgi:hypothetical protein